ncbi:MAG: hypothetical protein KY464_14975 [Gemmatimonadetes bacterium]|nr:hypothetical protein [Gemmatimonadota bacterium]
MSKGFSLAVALALVLSACASSGARGPAQGRSDLLVEEQIRGQSYATVYDAVVALRPNWLRTRGADSFSSPTQIQVYVDNMRLGGVANLQQISTVSAYYVQYFDGLEASARWGLGHGSGAIYVSTTPMRDR